MNRLTELTPEYHETFPRPEAMKPGILYISRSFMLTNHLCPCGCGQQAVCPIEDAPTHDDWNWNFTDNGGKVTMRPSILNRACPNKSHYYITNNKIQWL